MSSQNPPSGKPQDSSGAASDSAAVIAFKQYGWSFDPLTATPTSRVQITFTDSPDALPVTFAEVATLKTAQMLCDKLNSIAVLTSFLNRALSYVPEVGTLGALGSFVPNTDDPATRLAIEVRSVLKLARPTA